MLNPPARYSSIQPISASLGPTGVTLRSDRTPSNALALLLALPDDCLKCVVNGEVWLLQLLCFFYGDLRFNAFLAILLRRNCEKIPFSCHLDCLCWFRSVSSGAQSRRVDCRQRG